MNQHTRRLCIALTALLLCACGGQEPAPQPQPPQPPPKESVNPPVSEQTPQGGWIDYTPKYLWAYSSQFQEGFQNIRDPEQIAQAVTLINTAPLVTEADKQPNWGILKFATGEMQLHFSRSQQKVYLFFGGQIRAADDQLLTILGIDELRGR